MIYNLDNFGTYIYSIESYSKCENMSAPLSHWVLFAITYANPMSKEYFYPCPDGLRTVQKNIKNEFQIPEEFQQTKKFAAAIKELQQATGEISGE